MPRPKLPPRSLYVGTRTFPHVEAAAAYLTTNAGVIRAAIKRGSYQGMEAGWTDELTEQAIERIKADGRAPHSVDDFAV